MHESQYILRARGGKLTDVPAEKHLFPHDPEAHPQGTAEGAQSATNLSVPNRPGM